MTASIMQRLLSYTKVPALLAQGQKSAQLWFRAMAQQMRDVSPTQIMTSDPSRLLKQRRVGPGTMGKMICFFYDAKTKKRLPYWDKFPVIFAVDEAQGGFYGINMHYLSPYLRAKLMDELIKVATGKDEKKKLAMNYGILKSTSQFRAFKPCFKHYLYKYVRSRFFVVKFSEWFAVALLPTERFVSGGKGGAKIGAPINNRRVWADSRRKLEN
jgi:hypothetical protein